MTSQVYQTAEKLYNKLYEAGVSVVPVSYSKNVMGYSAYVRGRFFVKTQEGRKIFSEIDARVSDHTCGHDRMYKEHTHALTGNESEQYLDSIVEDVVQAAYDAVSEKGLKAA